MHIVQGMEIEAAAEGEAKAPSPRQLHPIELIARAYGIAGTWSDADARSR
jgi:hypothetical protein